MAVQWFYGADHARLGPFTASQLRDLKVRGQLQPTDMVWKEGVKNGLRAGAIHGLFESTTTTAVAVQTIDLPILSPVVEEPVLAPVATDVPVAAQDQVQEIIPESLVLTAISEDEVSALPVETAPVALPVTAPPRAKPPVVRMKRAVVECGAVIVSQDGERVRFRKKCVRCGFEESTNSVMRLMPGVNRQLFFCPKCRKQVGVSIRAL